MTRREWKTPKQRLDDAQEYGLAEPFDMAIPHGGRRRSYLVTSLSVMGTNDASVVVATLETDERRYVAEGTSRRQPGDKYDRAVGVDLAVGRALVSLGTKMVKAAMRRDAALVLERAHKHHAHFIRRLAKSLGVTPREASQGLAKAEGSLLTELLPTPGQVPGEGITTSPLSHAFDGDGDAG